MLIDLLILLSLFGIAGATSVGFFFGRKKNLELMIEYVRELERALNPIDKEYILLGLYSGFKAKYVVKGSNTELVEASLGLMPRLSIWYYPVSLFTLRHDRLYLVYRLKRASHKLHILNPKILKYKGVDIDQEEFEEVRINGNVYLVYYENKEIFERAKRIVEKYPEVLHIAITPKTKVLYFFLKPKPTTVEQVAREGFQLAEEIR